MTSKSEKTSLSLDAEIFQHVEVELVARLGSGRLSVRALLGLEAGAVINLDTPLDGQVALTLNGKTVAHGEIVTVGDRFGIRITEAPKTAP